MSQLAEILALEYGAYEMEAKQISISAGLHDIGKIRVSRKILDKPGKLDPQEYELIKLHTKYGAKILSDICGKLGEMAQNTALYHHEFWDGSQSYWGRKSADLPEYISIISLCDVFCALTAKRSYKEAWSIASAAKYIENRGGTQFKPALTELFLKALYQENNNIKNIIEKMQNGYVKIYV